REVGRLPRLNQPVSRAEKIPSTLAFKRILDQQTPFALADLVRSGVAGDAELAHEIFQIVGGPREIGAKNLLQTVFAEAANPLNTAQHHGQRKRTCNSVRHTVPQRDRIGY